MEFSLEWLHLPLMSSAERSELAACAPLLARHGLSLSAQDFLMLAENRRETLRDTGRVEFGGGILPKLIRTFCASPYLLQEDCAQTLGELQALFYHFKNETHDCLTDDQLLCAMEHIFHGRAQGSLDYLSGVQTPELLEALRPAERREEQDGTED